MAELSSGIDTSKPHSARMYDYFIGGKDHFAVDRETAAKVLERSPSVPIAARENRAFLGRAVSFLSAEAGIRQFLDIGTGLPTANNVHEVAQRLVPSSRIVYVDNDPLVLAHARALLTSSPEGATAYLEADLREVGKIRAQAAKTLDFTRPVAIMLMAVLHYIPDEAQARQIVTGLLESVPAGSFLTISHAGSDLFPVEMGAFEERLNQHLPGGLHVARPRIAVARFFDGAELLAPGVVRVSEWRPEPSADAPAHTTLWGGVARKL